MAITFSSDDEHIATLERELAEAKADRDRFRDNGRAAIDAGEELIRTLRQERNAAEQQRDTFKRLAGDGVAIMRASGHHDHPWETDGCEYCRHIAAYEAATKQEQPR